VKSIPIITILIFISVSTFAQTTSENFPKENYFNKGKIRFPNNQFYRVKNISIEGDSLSFKRKYSNQREKIAFSQIEKLQIKTGSKVLGGAIIGTALMFIFTLESMLSNEPHAKNRGVRYAFVLGTGAIIGGLVGLSIPVWETYNFDNNQKIGMSIDYKFKLNSKMLGASVVVNF